MNERARGIWARTRLHIWPEAYHLVSLPAAALADAAALVAAQRGVFAALVLERDEVSLTVTDGAWAASPLRARATAEGGPYRAISLDVNVELDVCGYLAPAAELLAAAGISIVPQCAYLKDHILVDARHLDSAVHTLEELIRSCTD